MKCFRILKRSACVKGITVALLIVFSFLFIFSYNEVKINPSTKFFEIGNVDIQNSPGSAELTEEEEKSLWISMDGN